MTVLISLLSSLKQMFRPVSASYHCRDIGFCLVRKGFLNKKQNQFLKIIIWYEKKQERTSFFTFSFFTSDLKQCQQKKLKITYVKLDV